MTSVWTPNQTIASTVNANSTLKTQAFTAVQDQQTFDLTNFSYAPGTGSLLVAYNGSLQTLISDYYEIDSDTFQLTFKCNAGDSVLAIGFVGISGIVNTPALSQFFVTATAGQTVFSVPYAYTPGANMSAVYVNGARLYVGRDYIETSSTVITLNVAREAGDEVLLVTGTEISTSSNTTVVGTTNLVAAASVAVTFATAQPDANYFIGLEIPSNNKFWVTSKTVNGFTLNADSVLTLSVKWKLTRD